jgi:hypothetical protein
LWTFALRAAAYLQPVVAAHAGGRAQRRTGQIRV